MNKKNGDIIVAAVGILVLVIGLAFFLSTKYVSKEFIYQETKECNKLKDEITQTLKLENERLCTEKRTASCLFGSIDEIQEIFYSPKLNECVFVTKQYKVRGVSSNYVFDLKSNGENYDCIIYKNGETFKEFGDLSYGEKCVDKLETILHKEVEKLKRWY